MPQLTFAKQNGVEVKFGNPDEEVPGKNLIFPETPAQIKARPYDLQRAKRSYIKNCVKNYSMTEASEADIQYIMDETRESREFVTAELTAHGVKLP